MGCKLYTLTVTTHLSLTHMPLSAVLGLQPLAPPSRVSCTCLTLPSSCPTLSYACPAFGYQQLALTRICAELVTTELLHRGACGLGPERHTQLRVRDVQRVHVDARQLRGQRGSATTGVIDSRVRLREKKVSGAGKEAFMAMVEGLATTLDVPD